MAQQGVPRLRERPRLHSIASRRERKSPGTRGACALRGQPGERGDLPAPRLGVGRPWPPGLPCSTGRRGRGPGEEAALEDKAAVGRRSGLRPCHSPTCPPGVWPCAREKQGRGGCPPSAQSHARRTGTPAGRPQAWGRAGPRQGPPGDTLWGHDGPAPARASGFFQRSQKKSGRFKSQKP